LVELDCCLKAIIRVRWFTTKRSKTKSGIITLIHNTKMTITVVRETKTNSTVWISNQGALLRLNLICKKSSRSCNKATFCSEPSWICFNSMSDYLRLSFHSQSFWRWPEKIINRSTNFANSRATVPGS
jgi:hypothetical protein